MTNNVLEDLKIRRKISRSCIRGVRYDKVLEALPRARKTEVLEQAFADIREAIHTLRDEQAEEDNRGLVGTCYASKERTDPPTTEIGAYRTVYFRVDKVQGNYITYFTFFVDENKKVVFEPNFVSSNMFAQTFPRVTKRRFNTALRRAVGCVARLTADV